MLFPHKATLDKAEGDGQVVSRFVITAMAAGMAIMAVPVQASPLVPDLSPLNMTAQTLDRGGDFDGDGRRDDLYLSNEADTGRVAVHVRLNTAAGSRDIRVTSLDAAGNAPIDLHVAAAGIYAADCGNFLNDCGPAVVAVHDSLILGLDSGSSVLMHWQGDHFETDFVRNDEAQMARALSAMYAVNF